MPYGSETWPVKGKDVVRLERNDARMVGSMCSVMPVDRISAEKLRTRLKLNRIRECSKVRRMQWSGHLERMEESAWSSKCRTFKVSGSFP